MYFTNPEGYNTNNRNVDEIIEEFDKTYTRISSNKDAKIILFDVCMHSGDTLRPVLNVLMQIIEMFLLVLLSQKMTLSIAI